MSYTSRTPGDHKTPESNKSVRESHTLFDESREMLGIMPPKVWPHSGFVANWHGSVTERLLSRTASKTHGAHLALAWMARGVDGLPLVEDRAPSLPCVSCTPRCAGPGGTATFCDASCALCVVN